jgi:uncharacterized protein (DUF362 family)
MRPEPATDCPKHAKTTGHRNIVMRSMSAGWRLLLQNRLALAIGSLLWLIYRSGTQPRRLTYPCQQVAAVNVGAFAAGIIPALWLWRKPKCPVARRIAVRRQLVAAVILFVTGVVGIEGYQYAQSLIPPEPLNVPPPIITADEPGRALVSIYQQSPAGSTYTTAEIETMVRQAVARAGGLSGIIQPGNSVGIKPNLVSDTAWTTANPTGITTDPRVVAAVVKLAKEAGAGSVKIIEGSASGGGGRGVTWSAYTNCGFDINGDHLFDYDTTVPLVDLNDAGTGGIVARPITTTPPKTVKITLSNGCIRSTYYLPKEVLKPSQGGNCDVLITVPTLKNHGQGAVTLALKSHVGIAPNDIYYDTVAGYSPQMKRDLLHRWGTSDPFPRTISGTTPSAPSNENQCVQYTLVDLNLVRPNDFAVVDGLVGITNGPTGTTKPSPVLKLVMAGKDSVAVDTVGALVMRYNPLQIPQLQWAWNRGLGVGDTAMITVLGTHVTSVRSTSFPSGYGGSVIVETTAPSVSTINLTEGQQVWGTVNVAISGQSDNVAVTKAELIIDGSYTATDTTAPYAFDFDFRTLSQGSHNVKVTVYDAALNEASISRNVNVAPPPVTAVFSASPVSGAAPLNVQFADASTGPVTTWAWNFGDGATDTVQNPSHKYQQGTYNVTLTVGGADGQLNTLQKNAYIIVGPPHFGDFDADGDIDQADTDIFAACSTGPGIIGPPASGCTAVQFGTADSDGDSDVDQADFGRFQRCLSGENVPLDPNCDG